MKKYVLILVATLLCGTLYGQESQRQRLEKHLYTLASDSLRGREAGTDDGRRAAQYILCEWKQMGLKPFQGDSYEMPFQHVAGNFCNLVAIIEGSDPTLKNEYIVLGAHYDHVGVKGDKIYNGADDNASGSSCLLEIARQLQAKKGQLKRSVLICAFDAEEKGLYGSSALVSHLRKTQQLDRIKLMLSIDMVGWYITNGKLVLEGSSTLHEHKVLLTPEPLGSNLKVHFKPFENSLFTATDTEPFAEAGIPTLAVTTGLKSPYHKPEDDADLIDYEGLDSITDYLTALTINVSRYDGRLASGQLAAKHHTKTFEVGIELGYNNCNLTYPDATFIGKGSIGFQGGLAMQYNFDRFFSLRVNILYDYNHCRIPDAADVFGLGYGLEQHSLLVPVLLQMGIRKMGFGIYFGLGLYYSYAFDGRFYDNVPASTASYGLCCDPNQLGYAFNFGMRLGGHWQLEANWYGPFFDLFDTTTGMPRARKRIVATTLGYYF